MAYKRVRRHRRPDEAILLADDRIVDVMEELVRFTIQLRPHTTALVNRLFRAQRRSRSPVDPAADLSAIATAYIEAPEQVDGHSDPRAGIR